MISRALLALRARVPMRIQLAALKSPTGNRLRTIGHILDLVLAQRCRNVQIGGTWPHLARLSFAQEPIEVHRSVKIPGGTNPDRIDKASGRKVCIEEISIAHNRACEVCAAK